MTDTTPTYALTSTFEIDDLRSLTERPGPFLTVCLRSPMTHDNDEYRLAAAWKNTRRTVEAMWSPDLLATLDAHLAELDHGKGEAVVIVQSSDGAIFTEYLTLGIAEDRADIGEWPRLIGIIEHRQRTLPHVVVETDRAGADLTAFDRGQVVDTEQVDGETLHIHRGHPGGWSQHRFQQRAENTWETNAGKVTESTLDLVEQVGAIAVMVAGDVRARAFVTEALADHLAGHGVTVIDLQSGDADGIADETLRSLSDLHARSQRAIIGQLRDRDASCTTVADVNVALAEGRVETLLVNDRAAGDNEDGRLDAAVASALASGAGVVVIPTVDELADGLASINRW